MGGRCARECVDDPLEPMIGLYCFTASRETNQVRSWSTVDSHMTRLQRGVLSTINRAPAEIYRSGYSGSLSVRFGRTAASIDSSTPLALHLCY